MSKKTYADIAERVFWTAIQAGIAVVAVDKIGLPTEWVPLAAVILAAVKAAVATQVGTKGSAAALPSNLDSSFLNAEDGQA